MTWSNGHVTGWEMQTGVMAYRKSPRVDQFWRVAYNEYSRQTRYWEQRSSGEQGAATCAPPILRSRAHARFLWHPFRSSQARCSRAILDARTPRVGRRYALGMTDIRFIPLPPAFNARPYTLFQWVRATPRRSAAALRRGVCACGGPSSSMEPQRASTHHAPPKCPADIALSCRLRRGRSWSRLG